MSLFDAHFNLTSSKTKAINVMNRFEENLSYRYYAMLLLNDCLIVYQQICVFHIKRKGAKGKWKSEKESEKKKQEQTVSGQYYALFKRELYDILHRKKGMLSRKPVACFYIMPHLVKLLMFYAIKLQFILTNNTASEEKGKLDPNRLRNI